MAVNIEYSNFDKSLDLIHGRAEMAPGTLRIANATHPIHTGSVRSRNGSTQILSTQMISTFRFYTNRVGVDTAGNVWWLPDSVVAAEPLASWASLHVYALNTIIVDSNGNFQKVTTNGTSGGSAPTWSTTQNATTTDGSVTWTMIGGVIKTGLTAGARVNFVKAPPQIGDTAYLFCSGGGVLFKIDSSGNVTNWGIAAPADGFTATIGQLATTTIDTMTATTGWSVVRGTGTLSADTGHFVVSPASLKLVCGASNLVTIQKNITVDLRHFTTPVSNSYLQDVIRLYIGIDQPYLVDAIGISFSLNDTTFANILHRKVYMKVARNVTAQTWGMNDVLQIDNAVAGQTNLSNVFYNPNKNKIGVLPGERINKHDILYDADGGIAHEFEFSAWHLPKETFQLAPTTSTYGWKDVQSVRINVYVKASAVKPTVWLNDLFMSGGSGMIGNYQYLVCFGNSTTGTLSNANPTPVTVLGVRRHIVDLASLPVSTDPQVDERIILRTVGNGGYFYNDQTIADDVTTTATDQVSDFYGLNGGQDPGSPNSTTNTGESTLTGPIYQFTNLPPTATMNRSAVWQGTMFWCGDTATGKQGRLYYSVAGNAEGQAGYTDITNDDDPTQALAVWNNQLFMWTTKAVYVIYQANDPNVVINPAYPVPLFVGNLVTGAPGTTSPFSLAVTPQGVLYQGNDQGLWLMNGYTALPQAPQILNILRGETVESYSCGTIIAAAYGRLEYMFSDGTQSFALNMFDGYVRSLGVPLTAIFFEPDTGKFNGSNGTFKWVLYEEEGTTTDAGTGIPFSIQTPSSYVNGEKYVGSPGYIFIDANLNGQTLTPTLILDNASVSLSAPTVTNSARGIIELTTNQVGRLAALKLTGTLTAQVEIFRIAFDQAPYGANDTGGSGQSDLRQGLLDILQGGGG